MQNGFEKKIEAFIKEQNLIAPGERVLVGLSGGADSACLVVILHRLAETLSCTLGAFHVNHGIRGAEADEDELFSKHLCEQFGIPFFAVRECVPERAAEWQLGLEEAGRRVRYQTAERLAKERGYDKIAVAHQQNDVAETLLFHLFRGSSVSGLASIPVKRGAIIRPLLCCERQEIEAYLAENGVTFCNDSTNAETAYSRNKIRHRIVTYAQEEINEGAVRHMAEAAAEFAELEEYLATETVKICAQAETTVDGCLVAVSLLNEQHKVLQRRVVHHLIGTVAGSKKDITREHVAAVMGLLHAQSGKRVALPYGLVAGRDFDKLFIKKEDVQREETEAEVTPVRIPGEYSLGNRGESLCFRTFPYKKNTEIPKNEYTKWFDYDKIRGTLCLRTYREGDRLGMLQGSKTVKSLWVEHKVTVEQRKQQLLLADEAQVLWIPGVRSCDNYRVEDTTKTVLEVQRNGGREDGSKR